MAAQFRRRPSAGSRPQLIMFAPVETPVPPEKARLCDELLSAPRRPVFVLGRNKYAERVARQVIVEGFIDDFTSDSTYLGRPITRMNELPKEALVVSCVVEGRPLTALERLRTAGQPTAIDYFLLTRIAPSQFEPIDFCARNQEDILANASRYVALQERLADETSRCMFGQVVQFRLTMDVDYMRGFSMAVDRQYFEDFLPLVADEVFVDGGGYDGTTTLEFAARNPGYKRIHYFEPSSTMMKRSKERLGALRDLAFHQQGLGDQCARLRFDDSAGAASHVSPNGGTEIDVVRLDDAVPELVSLVKLDIEGAECAALQGAARHIGKDKPKLAVCVYHDQSDFWRVPELVLGMNDRYQIFFRHYSEGVFETVMFFVPKP